MNDKEKKKENGKQKLEKRKRKNTIKELLKEYRTNESKREAAIRNNRRKKGNRGIVRKKKGKRRAEKRERGKERQEEGNE